MASGLVIAMASAYIWTKRSVPGAYLLLVAVGSVAWVCLAAAFEQRSATLADRIFWLHVQTPAYAAAPVCCFLMVRHYVRRPIGGRWSAALFLIPLYAVLLNWTNDWHHLYWTRVWVDRTSGVTLTGRVYGPGFWPYVAHTYLMLAASLYTLARSLRRKHMRSGQTLVMMAAVAVPFVASVLFVFHLLPIRYLDFAVYAFPVTGLGTMWVMYRHIFQSIVPIAAKSVVASMADAVIVIDLDRCFAGLNRAAERLFGRSGESVAGQRVSGVLQAYPALLRYSEGEGEISGDVSIPQGGEVRLYAASAGDVLEGTRRMGRVIALRDVTEERRNSEFLKESRRAAEAAAIAKSRFLANMSHEIRTPMNGVVGATELLLDSDLNAEQTELVKTAQESAHCLLSLLNDILDFSKIDADKLNLEQITFDLDRLMRRIVRVMQPAVTQKGLALNLRIGPEVPRVVVGDPTRLQQIVLNLLSNAVKFTAAGSVSIEIARIEDGSGPALIAIAVVDTGIGIAPERIGSLFQEFSQVDSSITRKFGGTGLGLAISQRLAEKMGGSVRVESKLGSGSKFTVELPLRLGDAGEVPDAPDTPFAGGRQFARLSILMAEDNLVNQRIGQRILEKLGCRMGLAANGAEAIRAAASAGYDLILMDLQMPEVDGLAAAREIRRRGIRTPIVALTASAMDETRSACEAAGMSAFITKPVRVDEITSLLDRVQRRELLLAIPSEVEL
ncbi:MAG TPA: histidine kinase N-terminal 7TM domain-containing protein [Bryobacteraceae bacterium]|nr:histidine kinase N-terminal 7TM domain-containing protein [Bryobacteraceae bacterium]